MAIREDPKVVAKKKVTKEHYQSGLNQSTPVVSTNAIPSVCRSLFQDRNMSGTNSTMYMTLQLGIDAQLFSRSVDILVSRLRQKLGDTSKQARFVKTVWGTGYAFIGQEVSA